MHEYSIVRSLLDRVEREAASRGGTAVRRVWVRIGELSGVEVDLLQTAYEMCRDRTICDGAALEVSRLEARWACPVCGRDIQPGTRLVCPDCDRPARLAQGDEIVLDRIEMEVA